MNRSQGVGRGRWRRVEAEAAAVASDAESRALEAIALSRARATSCGRTRLALALLVLLGTPSSLRAADPRRENACVSPYDIATRSDLLLSHLIAPTLNGEVEQWVGLLLGGLPGQVGERATQYFDARRIAGVMTEAFPVQGQPAVKAVDRVVEGCARTLGVEKPAVHVCNSPLTRIYAVEAGGRHHLVLTSGLLDLFAGRAEELEFVVGRALGHIRCGHTALKPKAYAILSAVQAIDAAVVPDRYQNVLPSLMLGRLFTWSREAEFSADRAGLLCCGATKPAYQAIMRLQHGLRADSPWIDPETPDFDARAVVRSFQEWQYEPFVKFVLSLKKQPLDHPYYQERLAALKVWVESGAYRAIMERPSEEAADQLLEIVRIVAYELAPVGQTLDPYVLATDSGGPILRTRTVSGVREAEWKGFRATDAGVDQPRSFHDGQPLFFEVWDDNYLADTLVGGFVVFPERRDSDSAGLAEYTAKIRWDWKDPQSISRAGYARVLVRFTRRQAAALPVSGREEE